MQQRQLGGALRFHVRCYYRPDAAAPTEAWPTDLAGNITGARCTGSTHPATTRLQWTAEGGSPRRPAPSGARRIIPSGAAAPAASRPRVRLRSARPDERVTAFGLDEVGVDRCREEGFVELHREIQRYTVFSFEVRFQAAPISVASVGRPPSISRACVLALRCAMRRAGGPRSRGLCLVERILPFRHAVGNDSRRR
jgi:hypothetical protein